MKTTHELEKFTNCQKLYEFVMEITSYDRKQAISLLHLVEKRIEWENLLLKEESHV